MSEQPEETYESIHFAKLCYTVRMNVCITSGLEKSVTARGKEPPTKGEVCAQLAALEKPLRERGLKDSRGFDSSTP